MSENRNGGRPPGEPDITEFDPVPARPFQARSGAARVSWPGSAVKTRPPARPEEALPPPLENSRAAGTGRRKGQAPDRSGRWRLLSGLFIFLLGLGATLYTVQSGQQGLEIVVVARNLEAGQTVTPADLATARVSFPSDYAATLVKAAGLNRLVNGSEKRVASRPLKSGQPLMAGDITDPQTYNRSGIPAGLVALALPVTSGNSVAGRVSRGDLVTLLLVSRESGTSPGHPGTASLLAEGLQVLEVQRGNLATAGLATSGGTVPAATSLTLLVTLEQAARIKAGQEQGSVSVVLLPQVPSARNTGPASGEE